MATNQTLLKSARLFHLYSGVFLAPALLFFAFTGGVQTFSLHETTRGSSYKPPAILVELAQLHKKQTLVVPARKATPSDAKINPADVSGHRTDGAPGQKHDRQAAPDKSSTPSAPETPGNTSPAAPQASPVSPSPTVRVHNLLPMKIFFLVVSIGLVFSTLTGLYMSYRYARNPRTITFTLLAGIVMPLLLLLF